MLPYSFVERRAVGTFHKCLTRTVCHRNCKFVVPSVNGIPCCQFLRSKITAPLVTHLALAVFNNHEHGSAPPSINTLGLIREDRLERFGELLHGHLLSNGRVILVFFLTATARRTRLNKNPKMFDVEIILTEYTAMRLSTNGVLERMLWKVGHMASQGPHQPLWTSKTTSIVFDCSRAPAKPSSS